MQEKRKRLADLKRKRTLQQTLLKANAVKLLQQKKLSNLRKETTTVSNLPSIVQSSTALTKLSPNEKLQMLSWLDLERNAEILASTDKKIKEKMKARLTSDKLVAQAAR